MMEIYETWDTASPQVPARSPLYSLPPVGAGTQEVESLTSYIMRLAQAHCLSPYDLLSKVILASEENGCRLYNGGVHVAITRVLNGVGTRPQILAKNLERLTSYSNIRQTAMVTFADVLSNLNLIRPKRAWCPSCFVEQMRGGGAVYELLLWAVDAVTVCPKHRRRLETTCPRCKREQKPLLSTMSPGCCALCQAWLGDSAGIVDGATLHGDGLNQQVWVAKLVGDLLAVVPHLDGKPGLEQFSEKLSTCVELAAWGSIYNFAHRVGSWHNQIRLLIKCRIQPTMSLLLRLCVELDVSLVALLTDVKDIELSDGHRDKASLPRPHLNKSAQPRMEPMNTHDAIREMEAALNENPPPSGKELRRRTGLQAVSLRRRHPVLFTKILDRYRNFHRSGNVTNEEGEIMLRAALIEDPPPSLQSVFRRMGFRSSGYRFYERFPELCRAVSARYKTHRSKSFDVEKTRQALEAALIEEPPPSFSLVANRIHHGRSFLRKTYPAQTAALVARYDIWLTASRRETNDTLLREVEDAIRSLQAEGLRLSLKPIRSRLSRYGNDRLFRLAVRQVKEKLGVQD